MILYLLIPGPLRNTLTLTRSMLKRLMLGRRSLAQ